MKKTLLVIFSLFFVLNSCTHSVEYKNKAMNPKYYHNSVKALTDVIVYDIFSPPVASRIYAYASIAAYEVMQFESDQHISLSGQLNGFEGVTAPKENVEYCLPLASQQALISTGKALIFSENKMEEYEAKLHQTFLDIGVPKSVFNASVEYGNAVSKEILAWANEDNYKQTRTFPKYTVQTETEYWKPTPPDYMEGIEPHWNKIRTMVLDSAEQFTPIPPTNFSMDKNSQFYKELVEVYDVGVKLSEEETEIAKFWDCNPYVSHHAGHAMFATKKITPGGHWIGITGIVSRASNLSFTETTEVYARESIGLFDAFISCWDEKWRSILVRPETLINEYIDEDWMPLLQTPPFPEYTSGHSVVSGASSEILTAFFGDNVAFNDSTEMEYGLPMRAYKSFYHAADEAAVSRLYGGIHYMPAIENGVTQGKLLGKYIANKLVTKKEKDPSI